MDIVVVPTANHLDKYDLTNRLVIILDILRSTTCITTALDHGSVGIIPALDADQALAVAKDLEPDSYVLAGEYLGNRIPSFTLDNSPDSFIPELVKDKLIIMSTTNGTKAIVKALNGSKILIGSLLNRSAVCTYAASEQKAIVMACSGTQGIFSLEDTLAAGACIDLLCSIKPYSLSDLALAALSLYRNHKHNLAEPLLHSQNGRSLQGQGLIKDIHYAAQLDTSSAIPLYAQGVIKKFT